MASIVSELVDVLPKLASCHTKGLLSSSATKASFPESVLLSKSSRSGPRVDVTNAHATNADSKNSVVATSSVSALLRGARNMAIIAGSALY